MFSDKPLESNIKGICDNGKLSFINDIINVEWKKGACDIEPLNSGTASAIYLLRYMTNYDSNIKYDIHNKPFRLISRGKAIGYNFFEDKKEFIKKCIKTMNYTYPVKIQDKITGNEKTLHFPLPRYYKRKIMPEEQQIKFADEHYDFSVQFTNYLNTLDYDTAKKRSDYHKINLERERELERSEYREKRFLNLIAKHRDYLIELRSERKGLLFSDHRQKILNNMSGMLYNALISRTLTYKEFKELQSHLSKQLSWESILGFKQLSIFDQLTDEQLKEF